MFFKILYHNVGTVYENPLTDDIAYKDDPAYVSAICCTVNAEEVNEIAAAPPLNFNPPDGAEPGVAVVDTVNALQ